MLQKSLLFITLLIALAVMATACSGSPASSNETAASLKSAATSKPDESKSNFISSSITKDYINLNELAQKYGISAGRMALALIICKLDSTMSIDDLIKKESGDLFEILTETATQKSITLETIDQRYGLTGILHSEGINVTIQANNVTSGPALASSQTGSDSWVNQFETAINAD